MATFLVLKLRDKIVATLLMGLLWPQLACAADRLVGGGNLAVRALGGRTIQRPGNGNQPPQSVQPATARPVAPSPVPVAQPVSVNAPAAATAEASTARFDRYKAAFELNLYGAPVQNAAQGSPSSPPPVDRAPSSGNSASLAVDSKPAEPQSRGALILSLPVFSGGWTMPAATAQPLAADHVDAPDMQLRFEPQATSPNVDLVLTDVEMVEPATLAAGPTYCVKFRNEGNDSAQSFLVGVLAGTDGQLPEDAPRGLATVETLAAGASGEVTVRLPASAMSMSGADSQTVPFSHLFVALDYTGKIVESDKSNNSAMAPQGNLTGNSTLPLWQKVTMLDASRSPKP